MIFTRAGELALAGAAGAWQVGNDNQLTTHLCFVRGKGSRRLRAAIARRLEVVGDRGELTGAPLEACAPSRGARPAHFTHTRSETRMAQGGGKDHPVCHRMYRPGLFGGP
jgi:hypothetical protein